MDHEPQRLPASAAAPDEGFGLVEMLVALAIFGVISLSLLATVLTTFRTTANNEGRVVAAQLAAAEIDTVLGLRDGSLADDAFTRDVGGREYAIERTSSVSNVGVAGVCASNVFQRRVQVTVRWPDMGLTEPVRADTVKSVNTNALDPTTGSVALRVNDVQGNPVMGQRVTLGTTQSASTDGRGCVRFSGLPAGPATLVLDTAGWVGVAGRQKVEVPASIEVGYGTQLDPVVYDRAAALSLTYSAQTGYPVPPTLGIGLFNSDLSTSAVGYPSCSSPSDAGAGTTCVTGSPRSITGLFPSPNGYSVWSGSCPAARPAADPAPVAMSAGATSTTAVPTYPLRVTLTSTAQSPLPRTGWTVTASSEETSGEGPAPNGRAVAAIDGSTATIWHSRWKSNRALLPQHLTIDMGTVQTIGGLTYLPRQDGNRNGRARTWIVETAADAAGPWTSRSASATSGVWADTDAVKTTTFANVSARFVRFTITEGWSGTNAASAAEVEVLGAASAAPGGRTVTASACGTTHALGTTNAAGVLQASLPRGTWSITETSASPSRSLGTATVKDDGTVATVTASA